LKWAGWAYSASLQLAESMPELWLKTKKPSNSQTVNPNLMCKDLLESYNPSPQVCKISSTPSINCIQNTLPKSGKSHFGCLRPLGLKLNVRRCT
jgi:hypothetical protein